MRTFSLWIGVPLKPKNTAPEKLALMSASMSPKVERWHSSTMNTMRLPRTVSRSCAFRPSASSVIRLIFWMDVTIRVSAGAVLFSVLTSTPVFSVACTWLLSPAKSR
ncbi:hypothetical protein D3C77_446560 [compost metagenome]